MENKKIQHFTNIREKGKNLEDGSMVKKDEKNRTENNRNTVLSEEVRYENASDIYD